MKKKEEERWALDRFLALLREPSPETIEPDEEPDFVAGVGLCRIGVEMTDLYWPHRRGVRPRQEQESLRRRVAKLAEQLYVNRSLPAVYVSLHFNKHIGLDKVTVQPLAGRIVEWTASNIPPLRESFAEEYGRVNHAYFPEHVRAMRVYRFGWMRRSRFSVPDGDSVPRLTIADVQREVDRKHDRYCAYRKKCEAVWLVLNVNGPRLSTTFEVDDAVAAASYDTPFDRLFLLQHMTPSLSELQVRLPMSTLGVGPR